MPLTSKQRTRKRQKGFSSPDKRRQTRRHGTKKQQAKAVEASQCQMKDESSEDDYFYTILKEQNKKTHANVTVNGQNVHFLIDTGATVDIIDANTFEKLRKKVSLQKSTTKIYAYGFQTPLPLPTTRESNTVQNNTSIPRAKDQKIQEIVNKYSTVFEGQGKLNNEQIKLHIPDDVNPVMQPQRRIPYHIRQDVSKELKKLQNQDIIEKVTNQPTPWISPIIATPKKDGGIRICVDMREANQAIERERHTMPMLQDFKAEVNEAKFFSKIDLKQAYRQLELDEESHFITTFTTHEGLYQYKRLNYGTNSAAEIFQNVLQQNLSDIRGVKNIVDDILIHGKT